MERNLAAAIAGPGTVRIRVEKVYGNVVMYPACEKAKLFAQIAGTKTITLPTLNAIQALGYTPQLEDGVAKLLNAALNRRFTSEPDGYEERVRQLEEEGLSTSDAQAAADVEFRRAA